MENKGQNELIEDEIQNIIDIDTLNIIDASKVTTHFKGDYHLKIFNQNIRSVTKNFDNLLVALEQIKLMFDVIILTECWISDDFIAPSIQGYDVFSSKDHKNRSDGVMVYTKNTIFGSSIPTTIEEANSVCIQCLDSVAITAIYRSPSYNNISKFLISLNDNLQRHNKYTNYIIAGDLNINIIGDRHHQADDYECLLASYGLRSAINLPTRITPMSQSCIDHIYARTKFNISATIINTTITDHFATTIAFSKKNNEKIHNQQNTTQLKYTDYDSIRSSLDTITWENVLNDKDVNTAMTKLTEKINMSVIKYTTFRKLVHKKRKIKPWISENLVKCLHKRDKLHKQSTNSPNNIRLQIYYKKYRNICRSIVKQTKEEYYRRKIEENTEDPKVLWNAVKEINNINRKPAAQIKQIKLNDTIKTEQIDIADTLNNYFADIGQTLAQKLLNKMSTDEDTLAEKYTTNAQDNNAFRIKTFQTKDIIHHINKLRNDCATGLDKLDTKLIKEIKHQIALPFTYICNLSITSGKFPRHFKSANIVPIYKSGDKNNPSNYRPISLLNVLTKVLENLVKIQLVDYLEKYKILSENQYGFRKNMGVQDAILKVTGTILKNVDQKKKTALRFFWI